MGRQLNGEKVRSQFAVDPRLFYLLQQFRKWISSNASARYRCETLSEDTQAMSLEMRDGGCFRVSSKVLQACVRAVGGATPFFPSEKRAQKWRRGPALRTFRCRVPGVE